VDEGWIFLANCHIKNSQLSRQKLANCHIKNRPTATSKYVELVDYHKDVVAESLVR
jgi:hypothetical protein